MALEIGVVTAFLAGLSITATQPDGNTQPLTIHDFSGVQANADPRECPVLQPEINQKISVATIQRQSFGTGAVAKQTLTYSIPYVLLYAPTGMDRALETVTPFLLITLTAIATAIVQNNKPPNPVMDMFLQSGELGGTVFDPMSDQPYFGARLTLGVVEFIN